ncbi:MAG: LysR family transcriptional regulator [Chromatiales bacterium]
MQDLNDLFYFVHVVDHAGFAPAARALSLPKSKLSRRIALLEDRLGARLIQRSTRRFSVTEIGQTYYAHCKAMVVEAQAAQEAVELTRSEPCGIVRLTCPVALLHARVGALLADFMVQHPRVEVHLEATNRRVDVISEGVDLAIRVRYPPLEDSDLVLKMLGNRSQCLVASPTLLARVGAPAVPADLGRLPSLDLGPPKQDHMWRLEGPRGAQASIRHHPRLVTDDMIALRTAAIAAVGIVQLPTLMVIDEIRQGVLVRPMPDWAPKRHIIHAVFPSKRGLLPSVRALIDYLALRFQQLEED